MVANEKKELIGLLFNESGTSEALGLLIIAKGSFANDRSSKMIGRIKELLEKI